MRNLRRLLTYARRIRLRPETDHSPRNLNGLLTEMDEIPRKIDGLLTEVEGLLIAALRVKTPGDRELEQIFDRYRTFVMRLMDASSPVVKKFAWQQHLETGAGCQSKIFMIDLLPHIFSHLRKFTRGTHFTVLDIGCGSGYGAGLLASLFNSRILGYTMDVSGVDIKFIYHSHIRLFSPYIRHIVSDVYALGRKHVSDISICSATIEHVPEPERFCKQLQTLSRQKVFLLGPFEEREEKRAIGHINIFSHDFFDRIGSEKVTLIESAAWGSFLDPPYKTFIVELPGLAK